MILNRTPEPESRCVRPDPDVCEQHIDELLPQV